MTLFSSTDKFLILSFSSQESGQTGEFSTNITLKWSGTCYVYITWSFISRKWRGKATRWGCVYWFTYLMATHYSNKWHGTASITTFKKHRCPTTSNRLASTSFLGMLITHYATHPPYTHTQPSIEFGLALCNNDEHGLSIISTQMKVSDHGHQHHDSSSPDFF